MNANSERLKEVLATYGADPAHWPVAERTRLLSSMAEVPSLAAEAAEIDLVLARAVSLSVPAHLAARITAASGGGTPAAVVVHRPVPGQAPWSSWLSAVALAASLALGVYIGLAGNGNLLLDQDSAEIDDPIVLTGIGDATDLLEDQNG
jgi:hypothetical protein